MKLSEKASALALAAMWGGAMFVVGSLNALIPPYGGDFLRVMSSVYPGYSAAPSAAAVIIGTVMGAIDGAIAGCLLAWLYNRFLP